MPDYFSTQAAAYAAFRPTYPRELFAFVAACVERHDVAWDCATGSGQAALALADDFAQVIATDSSAKQLAHAPAHERIEYRVATAEDSGLSAASADVITVAQALHWFAVDRFYTEARRVLAPGGALVVWSYNDAVLDDPVLDAALQHFNSTTVGPYWPAERQIVRDGYRTLPFPFERIPTPAFNLTRDWSLPELVGYARSWSATVRYVAEHGVDPVVAFEQSIADRWGDPMTRRTVSWPLVVLAGR
jgi:SAM-dependent methyltransferase